jgi:hypothetical protein
MCLVTPILPVHALERKLYAGAFAIAEHTFAIRPAEVMDLVHPIIRAADTGLCGRSL